MDKATKKESMQNLVNEFRDHVLDLIEIGMDEGYPDHLEFMQIALETFIEMKQDAE